MIDSQKYILGQLAHSMNLRFKDDAYMMHVADPERIQQCQNMIDALKVLKMPEFTLEQGLHYLDDSLWKGRPFIPEAMFAPAYGYFLNGVTEEGLGSLTAGRLLEFQPLLDNAERTLAMFKTHKQGLVFMEE